MIERREWMTALLGTLIVAPTAFAQWQAPVAPDAAPIFEIPAHAPLVALASPGMSFIDAETGSSRVVKGAPYRADAVSELTQVLMDGNKIVRRSIQRLARDGEGRTRTERLRPDGSVESVVINDVVTGKRYWLVPDKKRVVELAGWRHGAWVAPVPHTNALPSVPPVPPTPPAPLAPPAPGTSMGPDEARSWAEDMRRWARELSERLRTDRDLAQGLDTRAERDERGGASVVVREARHAGDDSGRMIDVDVVRVVDAGVDAPDSATAAIAAITPLPPEIGPRGQGVTTALGSKEFDRVRADGSRTTWTIAAGRIGNEKPIEIVSERWYAPDLLLVVSSRQMDPRRGETTYRLAGLKRGEPDAALFQVPADYEKRPSRKRDDRGDN